MIYDYCCLDHKKCCGVYMRVKHTYNAYYNEICVNMCIIACSISSIDSRFCIFPECTKLKRCSKSNNRGTCKQMHFCGDEHSTKALNEGMLACMHDAIKLQL